LPDERARAEAAAVLRCLPPTPPALLERADPALWTADPNGLRRICEAAARGLIALPADTPSLRLLADKVVDALGGISHALSGLALLVADPAWPEADRRGVRHPRVADWLPALVNAGRAFVTISAVALFWIVSAWPNGAVAITFAAITVILFAPRADQAYATAISFTVGTFLAAVFAAVVGFAVLPGLKTETFAALSIVLGLYLVPGGALVAQPWQTALFTAMAVNFVPLLRPANPMSYDTAQFYNSALAIVAGIGAAALSFRLLPPLSPAFRARRLLALTLRDLRRLAMGSPSTDWEGHINGRLSAMPEEATPLQRAQLMAALSLGAEIIRLNPMAQRLGFGDDLDSVLTAIAQGRSASATAHLSHLDDALAEQGGDEIEPLRARASLLAMSEVLTEHGSFFDARIRSGIRLAAVVS
jgi:uncharacterized membrane protein YccC